jgi:hypothetical protein
VVKIEQDFRLDKRHIVKVDSERLHKITTEMRGLLEDLTRLLERGGFFTKLTPLELAGYTRRNDRLRQLCRELGQLVEP